MICIMQAYTLMVAWFISNTVIYTQLLSYFYDKAFSCVGIATSATYPV